MTVVATPEGLGFRVNLAALPNAPMLARRFLTKLMEYWAIEGETADNALLLVSELTTNAAMATGRVDGPAEPDPDETVRAIIVRASVEDEGLRVEVWDNSPAVPVVANVDELAERGRGLLLVDRLADEWGCDAETVSPGGAPGKNVWFRLKATAPVSPDEASSESVPTSDPLVGQPTATAPADTPIRPAIPPNPPEPVTLPHRVPSRTPARDVEPLASGEPWWMLYRPDLATMARVHVGLVNLDSRSSQPTGEQQCVDA